MTALAPSRLDAHQRVTVRAHRAACRAVLDRLRAEQAKTVANRRELKLRGFDLKNLSGDRT